MSFHGNQLVLHPRDLEFQVTRRGRPESYLHECSTVLKLKQLGDGVAMEQCALTSALEISNFRFTTDWEDGINVISDGNRSPDIVHSCLFLALVRRALKISNSPCK